MKKRLLSSIILLAYVVILIMMMVFKVAPVIRVGAITLNFGGTNGGHPANFVPFKTILPYLLGEKGLIIGGLNLAGNIALLVPLGFLIPLVYRKLTWKKSLAIAVATGLAIEGTQTLLRVGIFDIDDVILNALGVMIGYWVFMLLRKWVLSKNYKMIIFSGIIAIAVATATFYAVISDLKSQPSVNPDVGAGAGAGELQPESFGNKENEAPQSGDLCGGTGGTGQIVSKGDGTITIQGKKGAPQTFKLTDETTIKTSSGAASESDLKAGDRVTVVTYDNESATAVFVCTADGPK